MYSGPPSPISDTLRPERTVLIIVVSSFHGLKMYVQWQSKACMENHLVPVACVHMRGVYAIQGSGLEGSTVVAHAGKWTPQRPQ